MKHITADKRKEITESLSAVNDIPFEEIDSAISLYLSMLEFVDKQPDTNTARQEAKVIEDKAKAAYVAVYELEQELSGAKNHNIIAKAKSSGLPSKLSNTLFSLGYWTTVRQDMPAVKRGPKPKLDRFHLILRLQEFYELCSGEKATVSKDGLNEGLKSGSQFHRFVVACAGDLEGFKELSEDGIAIAIEQVVQGKFPGTLPR